MGLLIIQGKGINVKITNMRFFGEKTSLLFRNPACNFERRTNDSFMEDLWGNEGDQLAERTRYAMWMIILLTY